MTRITFNKQGYDPFIDFLKAFCVLEVIFCHGFPYLNEVGYPVYGAEIPLFLLIQVFHVYKRNPRRINWKVVFKRILIPFCLTESIILGLRYINSTEDIKILVLNGIQSGGYGPGAYYPWIYVQMAIAITVIRPLLERLGKTKACIVFIILSEMIELSCSITDIPDSVYRLLCIRYIFLIYLGWLWTIEGIKMNGFTIALSICSLLSIIYFSYFDINNEPFFFNTGWKTHRWPCYFWIAWLLVYLLKEIWNYLRHINTINKIVSRLSKASYEIFLVQMFYYSTITTNSLAFIPNNMIRVLVWFSMAFISSICIGISINRFINR